MKKLLLVVCLGGALFTGCATNPYAQNYRSSTNNWSPAMHAALLPSAPEPEIRFTTNFRDDARHLEEKGYLAIGTAEFESSAVDESKVKAQARAVGADVVLYSTRLSRTEHHIASYQQYDPAVPGVTTLSPGLDPHASLHKESYSYNTKVFRQGAIFWRRANLGGWGARISEIPEALRPRLQRNTGAFVAVVRENTPASKASLLYGDVIIKIGNRNVQSPQQCIGLLKIYPLKVIPLTVLRGNKYVEIQLDMTTAVPAAKT